MYVSLVASHKCMTTLINIIISGKHLHFSQNLAAFGTLCIPNYGAEVKRYLQVKY